MRTGKNSFIEKTDFLNLEHPVMRLPRNLGQKAADLLTKWAGSWTFILSFLIFLVLWIILNTFWIIFGKTWDPRPFILLNLVLSMIAAIQAPVILMSQNRRSEKDRTQIQYDYNVNKKAEKEIRQIKIQLNRIEKILNKRRR